MTVPQSQSTDSIGTAGDPRLLLSRVERRVQAVGRTAAGSPPWIFLTALITSDVTNLFGGIRAWQALNCVLVITAISILVRLVLRQFEQERQQHFDTKMLQTWLGRTMQLDILMSMAWGLVPWLLWEEGNLANHLLLVLVCLSVGARFLVSRAAHFGFFIASFGPMALMLVLRLVVEWELPDLVIAAMVPLYAAHLALDARYHSTKSSTEARIRFAIEDMARELKEARDEALRKRAEAELANETKTAFLANMSHELRTPLNAILGFSEIIARECLGPVGSQRYREYAGDIHNSGSHLLSLINDLLDVAKIESGRMEIEPNLIEIGRALDAALKFIAVRANERRQILRIDIAPDASTVFADERALRQIVINLVTNAVKFTQEGGSIEICARRNGGSEFVLMVADNGPGIPKDRLNHIFKPFARIDNRYDRKSGGTGLGLALVRGLAELHGGRAWIESEEGEGTKAFVAFPGLKRMPRRRELA